VHVDKGEVLFRHGREPEMGKESIIKIDIGLSGVKHHSVTVKDNSRDFLFDIH